MSDQTDPLPAETPEENQSSSPASVSSEKRTETDRLVKKNWFFALFQNPEVGPFGVMILLLLALGFFSIPESVDSYNPFAGAGFNALGIRNNTRLIAQLGIIALGAGLLIIAGEFDLSIGSMVGFSGMCMAIIMKWGFHISVPIISNTAEGYGLDWVNNSLFHSILWLVDRLYSSQNRNGLIYCFAFVFVFFEGHPDRLRFLDFRTQKIWWNFRDMEK